MTRRLLPTLLAVLFVASTAGAQADHLQCFKIKDSAVKATYTADLLPTDTNFPLAQGCVVRVPAKVLCVDVQKTITSGNPPGAGPGNPAQKYLCYKVKCPKATPTATVVDQFGSHPVIVKKTSLLCAPEPAPTTTTTSTTTTTTGPCPDNDMDGFGACPCGTDCNDTNPTINPSTSISCGVGACQNTVPTCVGCMQNTCSPNPPGTEQCGNSVDDDCDGSVDEQPCNCTVASQCPPAANAVPQCVMSNCTFFCNMGFANCNLNPADGCEVNTQNNPSNCGNCGTTCPQFQNTTSAVCMNSGCTIGPCSPGYANCNNVTGDGCEVNTQSDVNNCGSCGLVCFVANGTPGCVGANCVVAGCNAGFGNCDGNVGNGCEVNLNTSNTNCGFCGNACSGATPNCIGGTCSP